MLIPVRFCLVCLCLASFSLHSSYILHSRLPKDTIICYKKSVTRKHLDGNVYNCCFITTVSLISFFGLIPQAVIFEHRKQFDFQTPPLPLPRELFIANSLYRPIVIVTKGFMMYGTRLYRSTATHNRNGFS